MFSGMGRPGQRVSSAQGMTTEVQIPVVQWLVSVGALLLVAFIIQRRVVVPVGDWYLAAHPAKFSAVVRIQNIVFNVMAVAALVLPTFYLGMSMLTNVINPNLPAPMAAQDPNDVKLPAVVKIAMGYGAALPWPLSAFASVIAGALRRDDTPQATAQQSPIPAVAVEPSKVRFQWFLNGNKRERRFADVALFTEEWQWLADLARKTKAGDKMHVSKRALETVNFSDGRARELSAALIECGLADGRGNSTTAIAPLLAWLRTDGRRKLHPGDNGVVSI